ncbi:MAG: hypothetical protein Q8939_07905 [Bacteroidota bacterium]|nr:hypothetical protein [Bacteroidota bacterium]
MRIGNRTLKSTAQWMGLVLIGILIQSNLCAQKLNGSVDDIKKMLCKKWQIEYMLSGGVKIEKGSDVPDLIYEFKPDNSFVFTQGDPQNNVYGSWIYNQQKKSILLQAKGKPAIRVISLIPEELILMTDKKKQGAHKQNIKMVFRVKGD